MYVKKKSDAVKIFVSLMVKPSPKMGLKVSQPLIGDLAIDRTETDVKDIRMLSSSSSEPSS